MHATSPGYSVTLRIEAAASPRSVSALTAAISNVGAWVTGFDIVEVRQDVIVVDVSCDAIDGAHVETIVKTVGAADGFTVAKVSDRTFLMHLGGKIEVNPKVSLRHRDDLSRAYTPGVARICLAIAANPRDARNLTIRRNTVAVVTDGSAVLGLGNLGAAAALPVMEGKAALFKQFGGVDAWPVCLDTQDTDTIVEVVRAIAPVYGGINLEDIAAPRCFEIERRLREVLDIPVFHDDQHGTAIVVLAALLNALQVVGKTLAGVRIVVCGAGAAGHAVISLLLANGASDIVAFDSNGALHRGRRNLDEFRSAIVSRTNAGQFTGSLGGALTGADVFIGVSAPNVLTGADIKRMASGAIVFALANPDPEVDPVEASRYAAVVATGRSDLPNQINNVLAFPGVFRGLLDAGSPEIGERMLTAAAKAIAGTVSQRELCEAFIVPSVFNPAVATAVAAAVSDEARRQHDNPADIGDPRA